MLMFFGNYYFYYIIFYKWVHFEYIKNYNFKKDLKSFRDFKNIKKIKRLCTRFSLSSILC